MGSVQRIGDWMQTVSGRAFWPLDPRPEEIFIEDIAHALSLQCRFAGHTRKHYSVAQHSVLVSEVCSSKDALWGLLHDATEAYLVDVPTPVKRFLSDYQTYERRLQDAVCERFGLCPEMPDSVKRADLQALMTEKRDLMVKGPAWSVCAAPLSAKIVPVSSTEAHDMFMARFFELGGV